MNKNLLGSCILLCLLFVSGALFAQKTFSMEDVFLKRAALSPTNLRQLQWIPGSNRFSHVVDNKLVRVKADNLETDTLDILASINPALSAFGLQALSGIPPFQWVNPDQLWFHTEKEVFTWSVKDGLVLKNKHSDAAENIDYHEKTYRAAYTLGRELRLSADGSEQIVAVSEREGIEYGKSVHRDEFGIFKGTFWSNSGEKLAFYRMDESMVTNYPIYILDSMPAQARNIRYPYAGATSHQVTIGVYNLKSSKTTYLQTGLPAEQYLTNVAWSADDRSIIVAVVNRAQNQLWLRQYDAESGAFIKTILEETHEKWVEPEKPVVFVPGSKDQFIYQSERDGFNHLYLYNLSGQLIRQLSKGAFPVTSFYGFSEDGTQCFYQTADESGLQRFVWVCSLKTGVAARLSEEDGTHNALVSPSGEWMLDVFSDLATPRTIAVQKAQPKAARSLIFGSKNPLEGYTIGYTRMVKLPSTGSFSLNARVVLPPTYDDGKKYPAIVYVYNGPHVQLVTNSWLGAADLWMHRMANEGYVVIAVDGRGSANRGHAFESSIHRRLGDLEMEDQLVAVQYLKGQSYIDPARIGVFGWSYGGFMTTSLLTRPESKGIFKCGVAGGPVLDWRMYEIMYTERYMDTPQENPEGYNKNSLFNYIDNLNMPLLMIHGSSDPVVLWQHSLRYIRECVKKGKQIDYFVYPEHEHNVIGRDRAHLFVKIERYFKANL